MADKHRAKENRRDEWWSLSDAKPMVSALFEESGEIAPVDLGQFGKRAGEIIARAEAEASMLLFAREVMPHFA